MKRWFKFGLFIIIILTTVVLNSTVVLGWNYTDFESNNSGNAVQQMSNISIDFTSIFLSAGYILGVFFSFVLAIQFMIATPAKKAEIKTRLWMYITGIVLLIAIPTLMDWVADVGKDVQNSVGNGNGNSVSAPSGAYITIQNPTPGVILPGLTGTTTPTTTAPTTATTPELLTAGDTIYYGDGTSETLSAGDKVYQKSGYGYVLQKADGTEYELGSWSGANSFSAAKGQSLSYAI